MNADLFSKETFPAKAAAVAAPARQFLRSPCDCGAAGGWRMVSHYEIVRCRCGREFWALQPERNGPFVAFPWPGFLSNTLNT